MSAKAALKAAKAAIDARKWDEARDQANNALETDPKNYFAKLFLGKTYDSLGQFDESSKAYEDATKLKPDDTQAWLGLRQLYHKQAGAKVDEHTQVGEQLAQIYMEADDPHRSQVAIDTLVDHARKHGTPLQYARALEKQLPDTSVYSYLEGRLPSPSHTYIRIAEILEAYETKTIQTQIAERRTRIGATLASTTNEVKQEIYGSSNLEDIYQHIIDWTNDDEQRREYEEKLLQRAYDHLLVLPAGKKGDKRDKVMKLAHDMVIIQHPFLLAWQIELEWRPSLEVQAVAVH